MGKRYQHYGWLVSPYSAKTRTYLRYKGIPFDDVAPSAAMLWLRIRRAVGQAVMPTMLSPAGKWMQDTSEIIDELEGRYPTPSITPPGASQRVASLLIELHADEWLPMPAMHYRWNFSGNAVFARREFGRYGAPYFPGFVRNLLTKPIAEKMASYRPILGIHPETVAGIEGYTEGLIATLETHLASHAFLLGARPCLGDFALFGPLWAHLFRDPASTYLFDDAPNVRAWFRRLLNPEPNSEGGAGEFLADDEVPETLDPIFRALFEEHFAYLHALVTAVDTYCEEHPDATRVPRSLGDHPFKIGGQTGQRRLLTFSIWMVQRPLDTYHGLPDEARALVDTWLERVGGREAMQLEVKNRFVRRNFKMGLER